MYSDIAAEITTEISQLHKLIDTYKVLLNKVRTANPTDVELLALAGILHSFYSGFENIFKRISKDTDGGFKKTESWHSDLLENMVKSSKNRPAVISENLKERLQFYLSFRHVFRSAYSYDLNWEKMQDLVFESENILLTVEKELHVFLKAII